MIAADQLVGREVSFSKSGFQFPKGAYRVPTESPPSEFASGVTDRRGSFRKRNTTAIRGECLFYQFSPLYSLFQMACRWLDVSRENLNRGFGLIFKLDKISAHTTLKDS